MILQWILQWILYEGYSPEMAGGGLFSAPAAPVAPVQDNTAQIMLMEEGIQQNERYLQQQAVANESQFKADSAAAENLQQIELQDAKAEREKIEREGRIKKGKRDLLFMNAMGTDDDENDMLLMGGG